MEIPARRIDNTLPLPEYKTAGAAAMDCVSRIDVTIHPGKVGYVPVNIALKPPPDHFVLFAARSSLHKRGLMFANGIGIGDEDFCGDKDEYQAALFNFTDELVEISRGDRVGQILILPFERVTWKEVKTLGEKNRGGFGTTGT